MITVEQIRKLVEEKIAGTDQYIVDLVVKPGNKIAVFLDNDTKIKIADCVVVSRHIESNLDREVEDFELEVSSAGMDQPLKHKRQYQKSVGRMLDVLQKDGIKHSCKLVEVAEESILVEIEKKEKINGKKINKTEQLTIPFHTIKETKYIISFK